MSDRTTAELLDEYDRYLGAAPNLPDRARLVLAERIIAQIKRADNDHRATLRAAYDTAKRAERAELTVRPSEVSTHASSPTTTRTSSHVRSGRSSTDQTTASRSNTR